MTVTTIALCVLGGIAAIEAAVIIVQSQRLARRTEELAEAQRKVDTRANLLSGGREAVKQMWQTAAIMRDEHTPMPDVRLERLAIRRVAFVRHIGPYEAVGSAWNALMQWAGSRRLMGPSMCLT